MAYTLSILDAQIFTGLQAWVMDLLGLPQTQVVHEMDNLVPMPQGGFVLMNHVSRKRIATNQDVYGTVVPGASFTGSAAGTVLAVTGTVSGAIAVGQTLVAPGVAGTTIVAGGTGTGGDGTYNLSATTTLSAQPLATVGVPGYQRSTQESVEYIVQLDFYGISAADWATTAEMLWWSDEAVNFLVTYGFTPLYAEEAQHIQFVNAEEQYEERWTLRIHGQLNPAVTQYPGSAATLAVTPINVTAGLLPIIIDAPQFVETGQIFTASVVPPVDATTFIWTSSASAVIIAGQGTHVLTLVAGPLGTIGLTCSVPAGALYYYGATDTAIVPAPSVTISLPPTVASGATYTATAVLESGGQSYAWTITNGIIVAGASEATVTYVPSDAGETLALTCSAVDMRGLPGVGSASTFVVAPLYQRVLYRGNPTSTITSPIESDPVLDIFTVGNMVAYAGFGVQPYYVDPTGDNLAFVQVDLGEQLPMTGLSLIYALTFFQSLFTSWALFGSNDGTTWSLIQTFTDGTQTTIQTISFNENYRYYQVRFATDVWAGITYLKEVRFLPSLT